MGHVAKRKPFKRAAANRLMVEQLEPRVLLSANFGGYGPDMSFHYEDHGAAPVVFHEGSAFDGMPYAPPHRGEHFVGEYYGAREPSVASRSVRAEPIADRSA